MLQVSSVVATSRERNDMTTGVPNKRGKELDRIDFVYCWAGESQQKDYKKGDLNASESVHHIEGYGFNEMEISLRSVLLFAPWLNKVHILVNGRAELPRWAPTDA